MSAEEVSFGRRLADLAAVQPDADAIIFVSQEGDEAHLSWQQLDLRSNQIARLLANRGVGENSMVVIAFPNCVEHIIATLATWKLGACILPLSARLPPRERTSLLKLAQPAATLCEWDDVSGAIRLADLADARMLSDAPLPDRVPSPGKAIASGGSTGRPKIIVDPNPWQRSPAIDGHPARSGLIDVSQWLRPGQIQLVPGPLYHNAPFTWSHLGLFDEHVLVLLERFDARRAVDLVRKYGVQFAMLVPTMMHRILRLPDLRASDFATIDAILHTAASCPQWVKRGWIDLLGAERIYEAYGAAEMIGVTVIRGDEWLGHPGSVGRAMNCDIRIAAKDGREAAVGEVGEIFMRPHASTATYEYIGSPPATGTDDGFISVGDMGWLDSEGWLFLADRQRDLIISGGENVFPAEVEAALTQHPSVQDAAVIGLPDEDWGQRVHALIELADPACPPSIDSLIAHCRDWLVPYKIPKSYEFVATLPRDEAGKIRRSLLAERPVMQ